MQGDNMLQIKPFNNQNEWNRETEKSKNQIAKKKQLTPLRAEGRGANSFLVTM